MLSCYDAERVKAIEAAIAANSEIEAFAPLLQNATDFADHFMSDYGCSDDSVPIMRALVAAAGALDTADHVEHGDCEIEAPRWVHGNLVVKGHLTVTSFLMVSLSLSDEYGVGATKLDK